MMLLFIYCDARRRSEIVLYALGSCVYCCCLQDPRAAARYGDRVPYVVVCGEPTARLVDLVVSPHDVLRNPHKMRINAKYYITKQLIPVLARVFNLVGTSVSKWYDDMPRPVSLSARELACVCDKIQTDRAKLYKTNIDFNVCQSNELVMVCALIRRLPVVCEPHLAEMLASLQPRAQLVQVHGNAA